MAHIYGVSGCLSNLLYELEKRNVKFLNSLEEIISFRNDFTNRVSLVKDETSEEVLVEIEELKQKITHLSVEFNFEENKGVGLFQRLDFVYKRYRLGQMSRKLGYMEEHLEKIIEDRIESKSRLLRTAKHIIEENKTVLLGAIGEQKAVNALAKLPDSFSVINNFHYKFRRALHRRDTGEWILSIQADHIVIGPSGVFVVETKNWSSDSIENIRIYSPVEQIRRTGYAMYRLLNRMTGRRSLLSDIAHHWGAQRISVHSIILMVNKMPLQKSQYVKILSLNNVCQYIMRLKRTLDFSEVEQLTDFLLQRY